LQRNVSQIEDEERISIQVLLARSSGEDWIGSLGFDPMCVSVRKGQFYSGNDKIRDVWMFYIKEFIWFSVRMKQDPSKKAKR
jgi:hypothetical protein